MMHTLPRRPLPVLLDFDGVIVDSVRLKAHAFLDIYRQEDAASLVRVHEYVSRQGGVARGIKFAHLERQVFGRQGDDASVARLCLRCAQLVHEAVVACPFVAGAERFLEAASQKTELHLVSGTPHDELVDIVERRGLARCFKSLQGAPMTKPQAFAAIVDRNGYASARVVTVGDAVTEYEAARASRSLDPIGVDPRSRRLRISQATQEQGTCTTKARRVMTARASSRNR